MVALGDKLAGLPIAADNQLAILDANVALSGVEGKCKADLRGVLRDVDKAAGADAAAGELGNIDVAGRVHFCAAEHGHVKTAAIVETECIRRAGNGVRIHGRAEQRTVQRHTAENARLKRERDIPAEAFLVRDVRNAGGNADAEIHKRALFELHGSSSGDDLLIAKGQRRNIARESADITNHLGMIRKRNVVLALSLHDIVHTGLVDQHVPRVKRARLADRVDLHDDDAAIVVHRQRQLQQIAVNWLVLEGDVALGVRIARVKDAGINVECFVEKIVLPGNVDELHHLSAVGLCKLVHLAAVLTGIGIGVETDVGNDAGALAADGVQKLAVHAERHGERGNFVFTARPADRRGHAQMGGDQRPDDALVLDFGQSAAILNKIAGRNAGNDRQVARGVLLFELSAHCLHHTVRRRKSTEAADAKRHSVPNQVGSFSSCNYLCHF